MLISLLLACGDEVDFQNPSKSPSEASNEPGSETASEPSSETSDEPSSETASEPSEEPSSEAASEPSSEVSNEPNDGPNPDGEWREELYISPTASHRMDITDFLDVPVANIWNGLAQANNGFYFSTHFDGLLTLRRLDWDLGELWPYVEITQVDDLEEGDILADHAMVRWNDKLYFAISTSGDRNLYLLSTDLNGIRIQDVVVQDDDDPRTNDPQLFVQSFAGEEAVCLRWGRSGPDKYLHCYDEDLNSLHGNTEIITSGPTSQLAHPMQVDDEIWVFSGDAPQRNLVYTRFDLDWNPLSHSRKSSSPLRMMNGTGHQQVSHKWIQDFGWLHIHTCLQKVRTLMLEGEWLFLMQILNCFICTKQPVRQHIDPIFSRRETSLFSPMMLDLSW